jgi:very-short-patch-repair endonuclease
MTASPAELLLAVQLEQAGIPFVREYRFCERRWRFDFALQADSLAIEVEGGSFVAGRHTRGAAFEGDCEKYARALIAGWRVLRVTPAQVEDGRALEWVRAAIGEQAA